jgi:hypothetical protein
MFVKLKNCFKTQINQIDCDIVNQPSKFSFLDKTKIIFKLVGQYDAETLSMDHQIIGYILRQPAICQAQHY